jgi:hypothetical protein
MWRTRYLVDEIRSRVPPAEGDIAQIQEIAGNKTALILDAIVLVALDLERAVIDQVDRGDNGRGVNRGSTDGQRQQ